jgi:hypothetical protein
LDVIQKLIRLCPSSTQIRNADGNTPLGLACGGFLPAETEVILELILAHSDAKGETNNAGQTPLHIYFQQCRKSEFDPCLAVVKALTTIQSVNTRDSKNHSPLYEFGKASSEAFSTLKKCERVFSPQSVDEPNFNSYKSSLEIILCHNPSRDSKTQFLRDLISLPGCMRALSFEKRATQEIIVDIMGRGPYIALLLLDFYIQTMVVVAFTIGCWYGFDNNSFSTVMLVGCAYWILRRTAAIIGSGQPFEYILMTSTFVTDVIHVSVLLASSLYLKENGLSLLEEEGDNGFWR